MPSLDTNVLVRLITADDARQAQQARALFEQAARTGECLYVPLTVVLELEWVLRSRYGYSKEQVVGTLVEMLEARELAIQDEAALEHALHYYRRNPGIDFAECLHLGCAAAAHGLPLVTFDRKAEGVAGVRVLS
jgi:predicted nucleic-acid-binding protein